MKILTNVKEKIQEWEVSKHVCMTGIINCYCGNSESNLIFTYNPYEKEIVLTLDKNNDGNEVLIGGFDKKSFSYLITQLKALRKLSIKGEIE